MHDELIASPSPDVIRTFKQRSRFLRFVRSLTEASARLVSDVEQRKGDTLAEKPARAKRERFGSR